MKHVLIVALAGIIGLVGAVAVSQEKKEPAPKTLQIEGSTTVGPIADAFKEALEKLHPGLAITVKKTGSGDGAAALIDGRCEIATMSRFMKDAEFKKAVEKGMMPVAHAIALDGVCVIVHPSNGVKELSIEQVRKIFTGEVKNWKDVGGPDLEIVPISRDTSSGTYECFMEKVLGKEKLAQSIETVNANPQVYNRVKETKGAIGYVGLGFMKDDVKGLVINGVMPSKKTIANGTYILARPLFLFTNGYPEAGTPAYIFCTFYLTKQGQETIEDKGFVPVTDY